MLTDLSIRDMLLIDRLDLEFRPGLNALTGETGAGKSILLDALGFVLGWRGRAALVRTGAERGEVTAVFTLGPDHPARAVLSEADLSAASEVILRRTNHPDGRKQAWVNDRRVSGDILRRLSDTLVELHGQHDDRGLLNPRGHRQMLDAVGAIDTDAVRAAWRAREAAGRALSEAEARLTALRAEEDWLRHAVGELQDLSPQVGEDATLDQRRRLLQAADRVKEDIARAFAALGPDGAEGLISDAARWIDGVAEAAEDLLGPPREALDRALAELGEAQDGIERAADALNVDAEELEQVEERLFAIRALARKHAIGADDLPELQERLSRQLSDLDAGALDLTRLRDAQRQAEARYDAAARALTDARTAAAQRLDAAMAGELAPLRMERAVFRTEIAEAPPGPDGRDAVTFTVATNPGAPPGPLSRIASGGELSRFLLALKVCLTAGATGLTLIFDEIDRGVGGATAAAVGRRLAALSQGGQILVVTHSPQVAALAGHQWRVEKSVADGMTTTRVVPLAAAGREDEIARMLAGDTITEGARAAARALLDG